MQVAMASLIGVQVWVTHRAAPTSEGGAGATEDERPGTAASGRSKWVDASCLCLGPLFFQALKARRKLNSLTKHSVPPKNDNSCPLPGAGGLPLAQLISVSDRDFGFGTIARFRENWSLADALG